MNKYHLQICHNDPDVVTNVYFDTEEKMEELIAMLMDRTNRTVRIMVNNTNFDTIVYTDHVVRLNVFTPQK